MTEKGFKRTLGLPEVTFIAIGFTIGAGVFVLTGLVFKTVGPALPLVFGLASIPVFISMLPLAMLGSAIPTTGGNYIYPSRMVSPGLAFVGIWTYILASFIGQIPLYALACAKYMQVFFPKMNLEIFAIGLLTVLFIINLLGIRLAAIIQGVLVLILISALAVYSANGAIVLETSHFTNFFDRGAGNLLLGTALLTFTYFGSNGIIELGGEIKNPGRVIPRAFIIAFPVITLIYILVGTATVGILPPWQGTGKAEPLILASGEVFGKGSFGFTFFILCGAILALITTLNALFIVGTKSLSVIINDGILPKNLGKIHSRFGTAYILLFMIWALSIAGVLSGFSLGTLANYAVLGGLMVFVPVLVASILLPRRFPEQYRQSLFKLKGIWLWFCPLIGFFMILFFGVAIISDLGSPEKIALFFIFIVSGIIYYLVRKRYLARRGIDLNTLANDREWLKQ
jgi:APA family basic amino acid/polyamine antiporter